MVVHHRTGDAHPERRPRREAAFIVYVDNGAVSGANGLELGWTTDNGLTKHPLIDNLKGGLKDGIARPKAIRLSYNDYLHFDLYLYDVACDQVYISDGTPYDHVGTASGTITLRTGTLNGTTYYFRDAGWYAQGCADKYVEPLEGTFAINNGHITVATAP